MYMQMAFMNARGVNHAARNSRARVPIGQKFSRSTVIYYARNAGLRAVALKFKLKYLDDCTEVVLRAHDV
jgi:hypothetical protein